MRPLTPVPPCKLVARRRAQLLGGTTVSAVVLATVLTANPALASTHPTPSGPMTSSKADLSAAFRSANGVDQTVQLGQNLTDADDDNDLLVLGGGAKLTVDLNGKDLNLDRIVLNAGSTLAITDSGSTSGHLVLGGASTTQDGDATGIKVGSGAALDIDHASVISTGSTAAAGIGGAADGVVTIEGGSVVAAAGGTNAAGIGGGKNGAGLTVHVDGSAVTATGGAGAAGVGGGLAGNGGAVDVVHGSITATNGSGASAIGAGSGGTVFGSLSIDDTSTVTTAPDSVLRVTADSSAAQIANHGLLTIGGTATGSGTIANTGTITGSVADSLKVTDNDFLVTFDLNGGAGGSLPVTKRVLGTNLAAAAIDIDSDASHPEKSGWTFFRWETGAGNSLVPATNALGLTAYAGSADATGRQAVTIKAAYKRRTTVGTGALPLAVKDVAYTGSVAVASGDDSVRYSVKSGTDLPHGLVLDTTTGAITGTPDASSPAAGVSFTIVATADSTVDSPKEATYSIRVGAAPQLTDGARSSGIVGAAYTGAAVHATGDGTITYSLASGTLPAGLTLGADGTLTGTPTAGGTATFAVTAHSEFGADSIGHYTLLVNTVPVFRSTTLPPATLGVGYSASAAADGDGTITYSIDSGTLPARLSLNSATGAITGTVTRAGTSTFVVKAHTQYGETTQSYTFAAGPVPAILTDGTLSSVTSGADVSATITANGDADHPVTFTADNRLPGTLHLSNSGVLTGTLPVANGDNSRTVIFTVTAQSAYGTIDKDFTLSSFTAPTVSTGTTTKRTVGTAFTATLTAGGYGAKTWSISAGQLPDGVTLNATTGVLSGTTTSAGTANFTVKAANTYGDATADYTIISGTAPTVTTTSAQLPTATVDSLQPYAAQLAASGTGATSATWLVVDGHEPAGMTVNGDGSITGTATSGTAQTFTVKVTTDFGSATKELTIDPGIAPTIAGTFVPSALTGQAYSTTWTSPVGDGASVFTLTGALPDGLTFEHGVLSGTPEESGTYQFSVIATNAFGSASTGTITLTVNAGPSLTAGGLRDAVLGEPYVAQIGATHVGYFTTDDDLPAGLQLNRSTGQVSGTPTETGTTQFTVRGYQDFVPTSGLILLPLLNLNLNLNTGPIFLPGLSPLGASVTRDYSITVGARTTLNTGALPGGTVGTTYSVPVIAQGDGPHTFAITEGTLPTGLRLNTDTGVISGTPTGAGASAFTVTATGAGSSDSVELAITVAAARVQQPAPAASTPAPAPSTPAPAPVPVAKAPAPVLPSIARMTALFGHPLAVSVAASSATKVAYSVAGGDLPKGVSLDGDTGVISGTPAEEGSFTVTVKATNAAGSSTADVTIVVPKVEALVKAAPATPTLLRGAPATFTIKGLKKGETWTVKVDGKVKLRGEAKKAGNIAVSVPLPKSLRDKAHIIKVSGDRTVSDPSKRASSTFTVTTISARKSLTLKAEGRTGSVSKLAAGEKVVVTLSDKTVVARGTADASGVFAFSLKTVSSGKHTLIATGSTEKRIAKLKVVLG